MRQETLQTKFSLLPLKYRRYSLTGSKEDIYLNELPDKDLSTIGFECISSQDLYPILKESFKVKLEVEGFCFARRFLDHGFGTKLRHREKSVR
jgi:hypothetical protein